MNEPTMPPENSAMCYQSQRRERLGWGLFPNAHCFSPELEGGRDGIVSRVRCELSFMDRLRLLISGRIEMWVKTTTEKEVGSHATNSSISVRPPDWLDRKPEGPRVPWLARQ